MDGDKMQLEERFCRADSVPGLRGCTDMLGAAVGGRSGARRCAPSRILLICGPKEKRELGRAGSRVLRAPWECPRAFLSFINPSKGANVVKTVCS